MTINQLMLRSLRKNLKHYYLYIFALIFSVVLYFGFVTLRYDPALEEMKGSIKGAAAIGTGSILLVAIVFIFLLYANHIFIKRRSKEIGLFQLVGMTKGEIFRLLSIENLILYFGSLFIGIFLGFSVSKLILLILFKITGVDAIAMLHFSTEALLNTVVVFTVIYGCIMLMNFTFIKRQSILSLFRTVSTAEGKVKRISLVEIVIGVLGLVLIIAGYYLSSLLFDGDFTEMKELFIAMTSILASVIIGTYFFYKGSVSFLANLIRKKKAGYLNVNEVLSLSSIMFRMKSNSLLLTIVTTVSALAIGLLSLSYIAYYSAEQSAKNSIPAHFALTNEQDADVLTKVLAEEGIAYKEKRIEVIQIAADMTSILDANLDSSNIDISAIQLAAISEAAAGIELDQKEMLLTGYSDIMQKFMTLKQTGEMELKGKTTSFQQHYLGLEKKFIIPYYFTFGMPTAIIDEAVFTQLKADLKPELQLEQSLFIGIDIVDKKQLVRANQLLHQLEFSSRVASQLDTSNEQKANMGLSMFIVGFLGLTFLVTSGCILYFKQMEQSEDEKPSYTILRKLGFSQDDLLKGIRMKQLYNFGIPLLVGLLHSYFAVKSGWFFFGTELWTPMIVVMLVYTALYSVFGVLSVLYAKKIIRAAL